MAICDEFEHEIAEMQAKKLVNSMNLKQKAAVLARLIGPLAEKTILSDKEATVFYLSVARKCTDVEIAKILKVKPPRITELITIATGKLLEYRKK